MTPVIILQFKTSLASKELRFNTKNLKIAMVILNECDASLDCQL